MSRTGDHNYYEDFEVGVTYEHTRGKTVTEMDNVLLTNLVLNTAQGHFNEDVMADSEFGERIVYGGITLSMVAGLASEDISENALTELSYDDVEFPSPVTHGDTLYATSEVLSKRPSDERPDCGVVEFRLRGFNQDDERVVAATKKVLLKRRSHYIDD